MPFLSALAFAGLLSSPVSDPIPIGHWNARWNEGAADCKAHPQPPLEVHAYDTKTFVLREGLCSTFEAPFLYLLIGKSRALLIDTGDVGDPKEMPLARVVTQLVARNGSPALPLLVVHTHRHLDHRAGDAQFARLVHVQVVGYDIDSVKRYFDFANWPNGVAEIDLGGRTVDAIPTPGHNETHVAYYDRNTALLFSGDFLMPGRLLIDDWQADVASAARIAAFVRNKPVTAVLGGHVEFDATGELFPWESQYHPNERSLPMTKADLLALPAALQRFNGFYTESGQFVMTDSVRVLEAMAAAALLMIAAILIGGILFVRRHLRAKRRVG